MKVVGIIFGVLTAIMGVYALCVPVQTFFVIGWLVGMVLFADGLTLVIVSLKKEKKEIWKAILGAFLGIMGLVILFCDVQRILTDFMMIYMIAGSIIAVGIIQCIAGIKTYKATKQGISIIVLGALSIIIGVIAAGHPLLTMMTVGYYIAFSLIMHGVNTVVMSVKVGDAVKEATN